VPIDKLSANAFATGAVANSLGFTPANKAGDTFTGNVVFSANATVTGAATFSNTVTVANTITFADSTAMSSSPVGFKNRIINGGMTIAQRGTTFTNCINTYTLDRYYCYGGPDTGITVSQQTDTNFVSGKCVRFGRAAGDTYTNNIGLAYSMETIDSLPLRGRVVTLSFTAYKGANFSGTLGMYLQYGTGTDEKSVSYTGGTAAGSVGPTLTTTATRYSLTATIPSNANEVGFYFSYTPTGTAGAADYFNMGDIQLEIGSVATPFEVRPLGLELNLCKRYYQILCNDNRIDVMRYSGTSSTIYIPYSVQMRTTPTFSLTRNSSVFGPVNTGAGQGGLDPESQNQYGMSLYVYTTAIPDQVGVKATVLASAEL